MRGVIKGESIPGGIIAIDIWKYILAAEYLSPLDWSNKQQRRGRK